jgi:hypothetical protein
MFESLSGILDKQIASTLAEYQYAVFQLDEDGHPDFSRSVAQNLFAIPVEVLGSPTTV